MVLSAVRDESYSDSGTRLRLLVVAALSAACVALLHKPLSLYGIPIFFAEVPLFFLARRTDIGAVAFASLLIAAGVLLSSPFFFMPVGLVAVLLVEVACIRIFLSLAPGRTLAEAIVVAYLFVLPTLFIFYLVEHGNPQLALFQISRKLVDLILCLLIYEVCDKTLIYMKNRSGARIAFVPENIRLGEILQSSIVVGVSMVMMSAITVSVWFASDQMQLQSQGLAEEAKKNVLTVAGERLERIALQSKAAPGGSSVFWEESLKIPGLLNAKFFGAPSVEIVEGELDESVRSLVAPAPRTTGWNYGVVEPAEPDSTWIVRAVHSNGAQAELVFSSVEAVGAFFSAGPITVTIGEVGAVGGGQKQRRALPRSNEIKLIEGSNYRVSTISDRVVGGVLLIRAYGQPMSWLTVDDVSHDTIMAPANYQVSIRCPAWEIFWEAYLEFIFLSLLTYACVALFLWASSLVTGIVIRPMSRFTAEIENRSKEVAENPKNVFQIPARQDTVIKETMSAQDAYISLFSTLSQLGNEMRVTIASYEDLMANMPIGVMALDAEDKIVRTNEALADMCNLSVQSISEISKIAADVKTISPESDDDGIHEYSDAEFISGDGSKKIITVTKVRRIGAGGVEDGYWVLVVDLTELKEKDQLLAQSTKLATLGKMATEIAHELNQPLNVISICTSNIENLISRPVLDVESINKRVRKCKKAVDRASKIITHMRTYGRIDTGDLAVIDAREAVTGAVMLLGEQLKLVGIELDVRLPKSPLRVLADVARLEQVVINLVNNAKDATLENSAHPEIRVTAEASNGRVLVTVGDNGGGVSEEDLFRIFEPFYTTKVEGEGTGLGGSISFGIIEKFGGNLTAKNAGDGLEVTIQLIEQGGELALSKAANG